MGSKRHGIGGSKVSSVELVSYSGFGFYWAWLMLIFYTPIMAYPDSSAFPTVQFIWTSSAWAHALTLLLCALFARKIGSLVDSKKTRTSIIFLVSISTVMIAVNSVSTFLSFQIVALISTAGAVMSGFGTAILVLMWAELFGRKRADFAMMGIIASYILSAILFFVLSALSRYIAVFFVILLPVFSGLSLSYAEKHSKKEMLHLAPMRTKTRRRFSPRVLLPIFAILLYGLCGEVLRGFSTLSESVESILFMGKLYVFGCLVGTVVLAVLLIVVHLFRREEDLGQMLPIRPVLIIMAMGFLVTAIFNTSFFFAYAVFGAAFQCCRVLVWVYSSYIVGRSGSSAVRVFGITQGTFAASVVVGTPVTNYLISAMGSGLAAWATIALLIVFFIFLSAVFILNAKDIETVWGLIEAKSDGNHSDAEDHGFLKSEYGLSAREYEVAELLAKGRNLPYIQEVLHIAAGTAQTHITHIYKKLDVHDRQAFLDLIQGHQRTSG